jgi:hypothetical protein
MSNSSNNQPSSVPAASERARQDHASGLGPANTTGWSAATKNAYENQRTWSEKQGK